MISNNAVSVKQLNLYVKTLLEGDCRLSNIAVSGEISNFKNHYASGHLYFSLKDSEASIRCVMFRSAAQKLNFVPQDGTKVVLNGRISLYEKDGQYQFYVDNMSPDGSGNIALRFEQLKEKLKNEGLFDAESKRPIPSFPKSIAIVTSETGAAVQDILNIISRRWPVAEIVMCPVSVQGNAAVPEMLETLERLYLLGNIDVIIIGRGGGSVEDLWAFNDEGLARKIYESPVPVISAVGHETDFTICDFVADLRAPTPSAAAELAVPDYKETLGKIRHCELVMKSSLNRIYNYQTVCLKAMLGCDVFRKPVASIVERRCQRVDNAVDRLIYAFKSYISPIETKYSELLAKLDALSPLKVMNRGYSVPLKNNTVIKSVDDINVGDSIKLRISDGSVDCKIFGKEKNNA